MALKQFICLQNFMCFLLDFYILAKIGAVGFSFWFAFLLGTVFWSCLLTSILSFTLPDLYHYVFLRYTFLTAAWQCSKFELPFSSFPLFVLLLLTVLMLVCEHTILFVWILYSSELIPRNSLGFYDQEAPGLCTLDKCFKWWYLRKLFSTSMSMILLEHK